MTPSRRASGPPPAPWGSFPLSELTVLLAVGAAVYGIASFGRGSSVWAFVAAASLGSLAGLEVAIREHYAHYRSHTTVLGATAGVAVMTVAVVLGAGLMIAIALGGGTFMAVAARLARG